MRTLQCGLALAVSAAGLAWGQGGVKLTAVPRVQATDGAAMFEAYCAACHGAGGKGDGPAAGALKKRPTDLTEISARNNGEFPALMVMTVLGNNPGAGSAHGSSEMPLWGEVFRASGDSAAVAHTRIYSLVRHIQSMQRPVVRTTKIRATRPQQMDVTDVHPSSGEQMFKAYCASCHGADGRGGGPAAASLTTAAPNLTKLARDNGGKFPESRVTSMLGLLAGSKPTPAHGTKTMPVWGDVFRAGHEDQSRVQLRIANLAKYVESIQQ